MSRKLKQLELEVLAPSKSGTASITLGGGKNLVSGRNSQPTALYDDVASHHDADEGACLPLAVAADKAKDGPPLPHSHPRAIQPLVDSRTQC